MSRHIRFRAWRTGDDFRSGGHLGTSVAAAALVYGGPAGVRVYTDPYGDPDVPAHLRRRTYEWAAWLSPEVTPGFAFTSLVPSWNASTPDGSWLEVEARLSGDGVHWSRWYSLGRWAETDEEIHPTSVPGQDDGAARVDIDLLDAADATTWSSYQLRVVLLRRPGSEAVPSVRLLGAMASAVPAEPPAETSPGGAAWGLELPVPAYSQQLHRGEYPQWDSGGQSWCSPTSTSMLLASWGHGPAAQDYAWVEPALANRSVVHAARHVFDYSYQGAGNWAFNVAYAARYGMTGFVTRLRSLTELERFIEAGIPLAATISFARERLEGAGYETDGHLLTVVGFDERGDVICNDPASHGVADNAQVRVVYDRGAFERVWLGSAGGVVYVVHPVDVPLPPAADPAEPNW